MAVLMLNRESAVLPDSMLNVHAAISNLAISNR
jgi:hypothetical protein